MGEEERGRPITLDARRNAVTSDARGRPVTSDARGRPVTSDARRRPVTPEARRRPVTPHTLRRPVALDALAALGFVLLPQVSVLRPPSADALDATTAWLLAAITALPLAVRRLRPVPVFACSLAGACAALVAGLGPTPFLGAAYGLYAVVLGRSARTAGAGRPGQSRRPRPPVRWPRPPAAVAVGVVSAVAAAALTTTGARQYEGGTRAVQLVLGLLVLGATWAAASAVRERRESARRAVEEAAERAKVEERLRIARDIHDVVTHSVGLIAVKAGVANHVIATHPEEAHEALTVIEDVSRRALRDMRATLTVLRGDEGELRPVRGLADLPELVGAAEAAGVRVELRTHGPEEPPDAVGLSAYRIVQEALNNTVKHAGAGTRCSVEVTARGEVVEIAVEDDGPGDGHRPVVPGGGLGLVGMRERAAAHGGTLTAGPGEDGGFGVRARLPY